MGPLILISGPINHIRKGPLTRRRRGPHRGPAPGRLCGRRAAGGGPAVPPGRRRGPRHTITNERGKEIFGRMGLDLRTTNILTAGVWYHMVCYLVVQTKINIMYVSKNTMYVQAINFLWLSVRWKSWPTKIKSQSRTTFSCPPLISQWLERFGLVPFGLSPCIVRHFMSVAFVFLWPCSFHT